MNIVYRKTYERCARAAMYTPHEKRIFRRCIRRADREIRRGLAKFVGRPINEDTKAEIIDALTGSFGLREPA